MTQEEKNVMHRQQKILGILCILLPVLSIGFGIIGYLSGTNEPGWYESISATYYANSRMMMIGLLFASSIYYWAYSGYDRTDSIITTISAITAMCIVIFPCSDGRATTEPIVGLFCLPVHISGILHNISAAILYGTFFIQTLRFTKHGANMTSQKIKRNKVYRTCAALMIIGVLIIICPILIRALAPYHYLILVGECFLQIAYGTAWLVKGECITALNDK